MARRNGGFIGTDGLDAPDPPTGVSVSGGVDGVASISFTAPTDTGTSAITGFIATDSSGAGTFFTPYSVEAASFSQSFSVASQEAAPRALAFSPDGTKMYIAGTNEDKVFQYTLSTAFDLSTASYASKSFSVASQENSPRGLAFSTDGSKMFVAGSQHDEVFQYSLSTAFDVSTASYDSESADASSQESSLQGMTFSADGKSLYITGQTTDHVRQNILETAFDLSTASNFTSKTFDVGSQEGVPQGIAFNADGSKMFVIGWGSNKAHQYSLSTFFDVSTASYDSISSVSVASQDNSVQEIQFSADGTKMFTCGTSSGSVHEYTSVSTALPTASPISITGLTLGTAVTFRAYAVNAYGTSAASDATSSVTPAAGIAVFIAGYNNSSYYNTIDYVNISTTGNASDWGDLPYLSGYSTSCASSTRGITAGNNIGSGNKEKISYITFASTGNAVNFGDMLDDNTASQTNGPSGNSTRGLLFGTNHYIQYVTMASTGNSTDFGDTVNNNFRMSSLSSSTRAIMSGDDDTSNVIQYVTIANTGNGTDFGDLQAAIATPSGAGNDTRGLIMGGYGSSPTFKDTIQYVTIASTGNSTDFGNLISGVTGAAATSSSTRAVHAGGEAASASNVIQFVEIASTGNATDFGDLTVTRYNLGSVSNAHGGLQ